MPIMSKRSYRVIDERFASALAGAREKCRLSQVGLAMQMSALGWPWRQQTVTRVETGRRTVTVGEGVTLALILGFELAALADGMDLAPACPVCLDSPPDGFTCNECGKSR